MRSAARGREWAQTREIARATLRQELPSGGTGARGKRVWIFATLFTYFFVGLLVAGSLARGADPLAVGLFAVTACMLLVAIFVVFEFATLVTGPDDLAFYLPLPVEPRAYVDAKVGVTCLFVLVFALAFAFPALIIVPAARGPVWLLAPYLYALLDGALLSALGIATILGFVVRRVPHARLRDAASWVQMLIIMAVYGGFTLFQRALAAKPQGSRLELSPLLLLAPSAWPASLVRWGEGALPAIGLALSLAVPILLFLAVRGMLSRSYAGAMAEAAIAAPIRRAPASGGAAWLWRGPEERAMALLIGRLFRRDSRFRTSILTIIPITVAYIGVILLVNRTPLLDPFTPQGRATFAATLMLYIGIGVYPALVKGALTFTNDASVGWVFFASPADPLLLLRAARRFILVFFIAPYLLVLGAAYALFTGALWHTLQHFILIACLVVIETDVMLFFFPQRPFSIEAAAGQQGGAMLLQTLAGMLILLPLYLLVILVYPHPFAFWPALAGIVACLAVVRVMGRRYAASRLSREELLA